MVVATNNKGKLKEIQKIFNEYEVKSLNEVNIDIDVEEDQDTFYGNASKKAHEIYEIVKEPVLADDSGLCIEALDDFPGVLTHRFMGEHATDEDRNNELLNRLKNIDNRNAKVVCCLVYYDGEKEIRADGIINGKISSEMRGTNGFGFDDIFELKNGLTLAQLSSEEKNEVSARSLAAKNLKEKLNM